MRRVRKAGAAGRRPCMEHEELSWRERGRLWMRLGLRLGLAALAAALLYRWGPPLLSLFMPVVLAFLMAWLLNPAVRALQKRLGLSRNILSFLLLLLVFGLMGTVLAAFFYTVGNEVRSLVENWPLLWSGAVTTVNGIQHWLTTRFSYLPAEVSDILTSGSDRLVLWVKTAAPEFLRGLAARAGSFALSIPSFAVALIVFLMGSYFITADYPHIRFLATRRLSGRTRKLMSHMKRTALDAFGGYVKAQIILSLGVLVILTAGFLLAGQSYGLLLALLLAVLDFIPIIGAGTVMVPWAAVDLVMGRFQHAAALLIIWSVIALFRRVAEPKAVGSQTGLSPVLSLVSIYVGMRLGGVLGMILGPVVCMVALNVCRSGIFDGLTADLRLAVRDMAAFLRNRPHPPSSG